MYYDYQRWYDPSTGRFISQDPFAGHISDPQSLNPYVYVENTPTSNTDPTGAFVLIDTLLGAGIGAAIGYGWCVAATGGWTSTSCGEYAALGAGTGALPGTTWGLSLLLKTGCEAEDCIPPTDPTSPSTTDPATTCLCPEPGAANGQGTSPTVTTTDTASIKASISNVERGNLGVDASIQDLGQNFVGREVPVHSDVYGDGRIDIYSTGPKSFIESKNVQSLYLTQENRLQLYKYEDAVGAGDLQYDLHVNFVHPDFIGELTKLGVAYRILPYIPSL